MGLLRERASDSAEKTSQILAVAGFEIRGREESMAVVVVRRVRVIILGLFIVKALCFYRCVGGDYVCAFKADKFDKAGEAKAGLGSGEG